MAGSWDKDGEENESIFFCGAVSLPRFAQSKDAGKHSEEGTHLRGG